MKKSRTFNVERAIIFHFHFCIEFLTLINESPLGVLKYHYITNRIRQLLIGNLRFLIQNLLSQLLCYTDIKERYLLLAEIVENLDLSN